MDSELNKTVSQMIPNTNLEYFDPFAGLTNFSESDFKNIRYGFKLCGMHLLFEKSLACEVVQNVTAYSIPNTPIWVQGLINHRGNLIPVLDLHQYWDYKDTQTIRPLTLFDNGTKYIGIYLDAYPIALEEDHIIEQTITENNSINNEVTPYIKSIKNINNHNWTEIDFRGFISFITKDFSSNVSDDENI